MTNTEVAIDLIVYISNKLNINAIPFDVTNDIEMVWLNYIPENRVFNVKLSINHRLTTKENIDKIIKRNVLWFNNTLKRKIGLSNPNKIYNHGIYENWKCAEVSLTYDLTKDMEDALLVLSKIK